MADSESASRAPAMLEPESAWRAPLMLGPERAVQLPGPWVIIPSIPDVTADRESFPPAVDCSIEWKDPDCGSRLTVPRHIVPVRFDYLCIAAADPSGILLLYAAEGRETDPLVVDDAPDRGLTSRRKSINAYFLCNPITRTLSRLPDAGRTDIKLGMVGLIADIKLGVDSDHYMVAELMPVSGANHATLLCYTTWTGAWVEKALKYPLPHGTHPRWEIKRSSGVITHAGKLWWVDLTYGIVTCDPFVEQPDLGYFQLPNHDELAATAARGEDLDKRCCVKVSVGELRCVQIHPSANGTRIRMWTVNDPSRLEWTPVYDVPWGNILADQSYRKTALPRDSNPALAVVNPRDPNVIYFFLVDLLENSCMFAVDVPARKVLVCKEFFMTKPPTEDYSSRFVHAWELPPSLTGENQGSEGAYCLSFVTGVLKLCLPGEDPDQPSASSSDAGD